MKRKAAKGLAAAGRISSAANEEFAATADAVGGLEERPQPGWNPYEVWRTRVKESSESSESSSVTPEHEPDPFH
jgi:hypothetical protein